MHESIWPVIAAALASVLVGYAWYHPRMFGSLWMREAGVTPEMAEHGARYRHIHLMLGFVALLIAADVLNILFGWLEIQGTVAAMRIGALIWIGFVVPVSAGAFLWEHRSLAFYLLNISYWFVILLVMSVFLVL